MNKKHFFTILFLLSMISSTFAQQNNALGLRFNNMGGEVTFQTKLKDANRLELDLGYYNKNLNVVNSWTGVNITGIYQWVRDLSDLADGFKWYYGVGGALGLAGSTNQFAIGVAGNIGIEYNFEIPLQLSLDYRPTVYVPYANQFDGIFASARYRF